MRVLIYSDAHANRDALRAIFSRVEFDFSLFLGDIVDYGPWPAETLDLVRANSDVMVMGNHDNAVAFGVDCRCGQSNHDISVYTRETITVPSLSREDVAFLQTLKNRDSVDVDGITLNLVHGSPRNPLYEYVNAKNIDQSIFTTDMGSPLDAGYYLMGHTHEALYLQIGKYVAINPGSAGQARDNDPRPSICILDTEKNSLKFMRIDYDTRALREALEYTVKDKAMLRKDLELFNLL